MFPPSPAPASKTLVIFEGTPARSRAKRVIRYSVMGDRLPGP